MRTYLDFEKPIAELEGRIDDLRATTGSDVGDEVRKLEGKALKLLTDTYSSLTSWQKTSVARHQARPHFSDYVAGLMEDFTPLAGDRAFGEDEAIIGGPASFRGRSVMVIGHEKGRDTDSRLKHNFGMARPEGYRKAIRLMEMAERFNMPVITLVLIHRGHIQGSGRKSAAKLKRSLPQPRSALVCACRLSRRLSVKAAPAGPSPWRRQIVC